ncbi:hypothetical protein DFJ58DRAFT_795032 [Suillus subalutaceus]|uniref:uncharacterized protein n=1 Tax=Suillus subalutaceus TaxID=48586 RepID=UPI001B87C95B|nr:uncharacterized protein DFJ58DRAFT_795032 [Suillus subalutaceus]KAG1849279.1 hypothetical protein DFJ58DRAFT_795032 [Suillus subalutaceus]
MPNQPRLHSAGCSPPSSSSRCSPPSSSRCSPPSSSSCSPSSLSSPSRITIDDLLAEKSTFANLTIRKIGHHKEARGHSGWEHEFLVAEMYNDSEGIIPLLPDVVRVVLGDTLHPIPLLDVLSHFGYHPSNLGRSCEFDSPPSVGEIASVLAEKSIAGGEYSSRDKNCYWYANAVFNHCSNTYGGGISKGPYYDDLGRFMGGAPHNAVKEGLVNVVGYGAGIVVGVGVGIASLPLIFGGVAVTTAVILVKGKGESQAEPLRS